MGSINPQTRLKVALKMSISKLKFTQDKETAIAKQQRRALADLLKAGKEQSAKIRVENLIRDDIHVELCEHLELMCELLLARLNLLDSKTCDPGLESTVKSIIYAAPHADVKELSTVRDILAKKFGQEFYKSAVANEDNCVSPNIVTRVEVKPPSPELVSLYLQEIARAYDVPFSELPAEDDDELDRLEKEALDSDSDSGGSKEKPEKREKPEKTQSTEKKKGAGKNVDDSLAELEALKERFAKLKG